MVKYLLTAAGAGVVVWWWLKMGKAQIERATGISPVKLPVPATGGGAATATAAAQGTSSAGTIGAGGSLGTVTLPGGQVIRLPGYVQGMPGTAGLPAAPVLTRLPLRPNVVQS